MSCLIAACGVSPIVRIADNQGYLVKSEFLGAKWSTTIDHIMIGALDAGAHGVLVPLLYTPEDARKLVTSAKFPPQGQRGFGSPFPMASFSAEMGAGEYLQQANDVLLTIVQIETREALEHIDEIAAINGIDCLFVGPFDLGNNIGYPIIDGVMHDELHAAIAKVLKAARSANKKCGIFCTSGIQGKLYADQGFDMISIATDMHVLPAAIIEALQKSKGLEAGPKFSGPYGK